MLPLNTLTANAYYCCERFLQFGEGNFLRGFVEWIIERHNKTVPFGDSVVIVQPRAGGKVARLEEQDGLYHVNLLGLNKGQTVDSVELITCVNRLIDPYKRHDLFLALANQPNLRFIVSNTTEAGIAFDPACRLNDTPPEAFPAKLTQLLYHRYLIWEGNPNKGFIILPCELIPHNGRHLADCIRRYIDLWADDMGEKYEGFRQWFEESCYVCTTLVDRIVPGFPQKDVEALQERIGYEDNQIVQAEPFHLWVIETAPNLPLEKLRNELKLSDSGLNVILTNDESPYHERKVTLLNGPHTVLSPVAFLAGLNIVRDACQHEVIGPFIHHVMYDELLPTLNLPEDELRRFADDVMERFCNPFVDHQLTSIMLNSLPKFQTRDLPALKTYHQRFGALPRGIVLGLAAICVYYRGGQRADGILIQPNDDARIMQLLTELWATGDVSRVAEGVLAAKELIWHEHGDLNTIPGLTKLLADSIQSILDNGMMETVKKLKIEKLKN